MWDSLIYFSLMTAFFTGITEGMEWVFRTEHIWRDWRV